jgi:predicted Abi (CAAX) family protease
MTDLELFWQLVGRVFALDFDALQQVVALPNSLAIALAIVLAAGFSQAIAQGIVLVINRVKPIRFLFSLLIGAVLFTAGYCFLVFSTWLITLIPSTTSVPLTVLASVMGVSYTPIIFSFLGALPYLGVPILSLLSVWHLLALVVGFAAVTDLPASEAFGYVVLGWVMLQIVQNTIGQPLVSLGRWLVNQAAGVDLAITQRELLKLLRAGLAQSSSPIMTPKPGYLLEMVSSDAFSRQFPEQPSNGQPSNGARTERSPLTGAESPTSSPISLPISSSRLIQQEQYPHSHPPQSWTRLLGLLGMVLLAVVVMILLVPVRLWVSNWHQQLPGVVQFILDLIWIGMVALVIAGLLAPLETLGWWAGWYKDDVDTTLNAEPLTTPQSDRRTARHTTRYVVYLDGIAKFGCEYLPDVEMFLDQLTRSLPSSMVLIQGIMPYSVLNSPLHKDRPLAFLWQLVEYIRQKNPSNLLGFIINLRNLLTVVVSADKRYGPLYNRGIAQLIYNDLIQNGYQPNSGIPITLIGFSGGAQMAAASAPFLKSVLSAPIDVISLGGVISGNCNVLKLEHLYHLVGENDGVERLGCILFPGRWALFPLSYWNRAKRRGKISVMSLAAVGHQLPGGLMDPNTHLPDGRSFLQQTIDRIIKILCGDVQVIDPTIDRKASNYQHYQQADFNHPDHYPLDQPIASEWYRPIAPWMGRLILPRPEARQQVKGVWFEVHHAPANYQYLVGQVVLLRWSLDPDVQTLVRAVTQDVHFSAEAEYTSIYGGLIHPDRLNHWQQVDPLESLAGSRPNNDMIVMLDGEVGVESGLTRQPVSVGERVRDAVLHSAPFHPSVTTAAPILRIRQQPVQITGRFYGLVKVLHPVAATDRMQVVHFNRATQQFDGAIETISMPPVRPNQYGCPPFTNQGIERSPLNETGWYIYGAPDAAGQFVVQAIAPRALLRLHPDQVITGEKAACHYIRKQAWADIAAQKGRISSALLCPNEAHPPQKAALGQHPPSCSTKPTCLGGWHEGDRALVLHTYGGIGGKKQEAAAASPIFLGHFAFGLAEVVREPLADELQFDIRYYQVYTHNTDGLVAGVLHWSRYLGDRQFGWIGVRPICDILLKLNTFTGYYEFDGMWRSPLDGMVSQLQAMTARYRIGDGTGATYVGPANNCAQDSNRALFASIRQLEHSVQSRADWLQTWSVQHPQQAQRFEQLMQLEQALKRELQPFGYPRSDWEKDEYNLGTTLEDEPLRNWMTGLASWRTMLPRLASDTIAKIFLEHGASAWVLRANQLGGFNPEIEPIAPMTL